MKKTLSFLVALVLMLSAFSLSAFAAETVGEDLVAADVNPGDTVGSSSGNVDVNISGTLTNKYSVDITFTNLSFTYAGAGVWDPDSHQYVTPDDASTAWTGSGTVAIENHSDLPVDYKVEAQVTNTSVGSDVKIQLNSGDTAVTGSLAKVNIGDAEGQKADPVTVTVTGKPALASFQGTLGTVTVTITKPAS